MALQRLTGRQRHALALIRSQRGHAGLGYLAKQMGVSDYSAKITVASLVRRGLVSRWQDRNVVRYKPTSRL